MSRARARDKLEIMQIDYPLRRPSVSALCGSGRAWKHAFSSVRFSRTRRTAKSLTGVVLASAVLFLLPEIHAEPNAGSPLRAFSASGVVKELPSDGKTVLIQHEAIPNFMDAMTMPFKVKQPNELAKLHTGDKVSFRLQVTDTESWIEGITKTGETVSLAEARPTPRNEAPTSSPTKPHHPLLDFPFTNELGEPTRLSDFRGQALAITFFFTRCPIPDYCPRLSKNFEQAARKLSVLPNAPTNWHFLSVSFDTDFDTPARLRAYGQGYQYDPNHWSFLTGPKDKIAELAKLSNATFEPENGFFSHNFRTLIIDAAGRMQMTFPIGGDLGDVIVAEILKAAAVRLGPVAAPTKEDPGDSAIRLSRK